MRDEAIGIRRLRPRGRPPAFPLPARYVGSLSAAESAALRSLLSARDPAALAIIDHFLAADADRAEAEAADETIDGLRRRIAREQFGSAHSAGADAANHRRASIRAGAQGRSSASAVAVASASASAESLDVYQLSAMLVSLCEDGYLTPSSLRALLCAVDERRDPTLLAAFSLYKEGLQRGEADGAGSSGGTSGDGSDGGSGGAGWPELWDTLQRCWQRIQRQQTTPADSAQSSFLHASSYLSPETALLLRHVGSCLIDSLCGSGTLSASGAAYPAQSAARRRRQPFRHPQLRAERRGQRAPARSRGQPGDAVG